MAFSLRRTETTPYSLIAFVNDFLRSPAFLFAVYPYLPSSPFFRGPILFCDLDRERERDERGIYYKNEKLMISTVIMFIHYVFIEFLQLKHKENLFVEITNK
jgi:hypothetical protein